MGLFGKKKTRGFMDVIRCDEPSYLVWKWHPVGCQEGKNKRENEIRWGSSLRVKDGEVAVFVYKQKDGTVQDFIEGPFDETIKTKNLPVLINLMGALYDGSSPFQAEIYFINLAKIIQVKFGVPYFDVYDPRFSDFGVPVAVRGTISFQIKDYREFIKLHRLGTFRLEDFQNQIRDVVVRYVKDTVTNIPAANDIPLIQIETKTSLINDSVELDIKERLQEDFGVIVSGVDIGAIEIDKSSEGYIKLLSVTRDVDSAIISAQKEANVKNIHDMQRINVENYEESLRVQREEGQYSMHKGTQSQNFAAYQVEAQTQVGVAGAEALGHMGENGAGNISLGDGGGTGLNPASMMAAMAVGGAVGQNLAGTMNNMLGNAPQPSNGIAPPPLPKESFFVAVAGKQEGPFTLDVLLQMKNSGTFTSEQLVWQAGMENWTKASEVQALKSMFDIDKGITPPPIPQ
jgi:membrane protease subunit (stomatin/prohibitin family)